MRPEVRAARRAYARAYMQQRRARGLCARCAKPLPANYPGWRHYECKRREREKRVKHSPDSIVG